MIKLFKNNSFGWLLLASLIIVELGVIGLPNAIRVNSEAGTQSAGRCQKTSASLKFIEIVNARDGWAASRSGDVLRTEDGGIIWYDVTPVNLPKAPTPTMPFFLKGDSQTAWLLDLRDETAYRTTDGGKHWRKGAPAG